MKFRMAKCASAFGQRGLDAHVVTEGVPPGTFEFVITAAILPA
jgi:hypothetical protein